MSHPAGGKSTYFLNFAQKDMAAVGVSPGESGEFCRMSMRVCLSSNGVVGIAW